MAGVEGLIAHLETERTRANLPRQSLDAKAGYPRGSWEQIVSRKRQVAAWALNDYAQALGFKLMLWRDGVKK